MRVLFLLLTFASFVLANIPTQTYTPYGKLISHDGDATNSFLFTGEQYDSEIKSYYLRARYYNPNIARFLSRDTYDGKIADPLSQNHYLYAGGNPVVYVDPSGRMSITSQSFAIATMGILGGGALVTGFLFNDRGISCENIWLTVGLYNAHIWILEEYA